MPLATRDADRPGAFPRAEMTGFFSALLGDDRGQDLLEYAFLTAAIGLAAIVVFDQIRQAIGTTSGTWESDVNNLWQPPDPGAGS